MARPGGLATHWVGVGRAVVRLLYDDPEVGHLIDSVVGLEAPVDEAPIGLVVAGSPSTGLYVVSDCSGVVVGRVRTPSDAVEIVRRCFESRARSIGPGEMRVRIRALQVEGGDLTLLGPGIATQPPLVERRLVRLGHAIVDAETMVFDTRNPARVLGVASPPRRTSIDAHVVTPDATVSTMLVLSPDITPPPAAVAVLIASMCMSGSRDERLRFASRLSANLEVRALRTDSGGEVLACLGRSVNC